MKTFTLKKLLYFFKTQYVLCFDGIEEIVLIIDDESIPENEKEELILRLLREYGLQEREYKDEFAEQKQQALRELERELGEDNYHEQFMTQLMSLNLLNGKIRVEVSIN